MSTKAKYGSTFLRYFESTTHESTRIIAPVYFEDDFIGANTVVPAAGSSESGVAWVKKIVGAAPPTLAIKADAAGGQVECALTADSQKQNAELYMDDQRQFDISKGVIFEARISPSVLPTGNAEAVIGLIGDWADGLDATTYSAFFTLDGSGEIFCETDDNVTDNSVTSGVTLVNTDWAVLRIEILDVTNILFYVNGNRVAGSTTFGYAATGANAVLQPVAGVYKASGTGVGTLLIDYIRVAQVAR